MFKVSGCEQSFKIMLNIILRQNVLVLFFFTGPATCFIVQQENSDFCLAERLKAQSKSHKGGMVYVCASVCAFELV